MKVTQRSFGAVFLALFLGVNVQAQNVGIGVINPASKLTVNGNFAVGADYNAAAPANGAIIEGTVGIGTSTPNLGSQLHVYSPTQTAALIEAGGAVNGNWADLRLQMDASGNHHSVIEMTNPTSSTGFQLWTDPSNDNSNDFAIYDFAAKSWRVWLNPSGFLGIGTTDPLAPLDVATGTGITANVTASFFGYTSTVFSHGSLSGGNGASAIFAADVWCNSDFVAYGGGTITASDARLKNIIGRSDSAEDLDVLKKIEITDYTLKDRATYGDTPLKKVVAQQVKRVYPTAVKSLGLKGVTFIPDIYLLADSVKSEKPNVYRIHLVKAHGLNDGDTVRLITPENPSIAATVAVVDDKTFTVTTKQPLGDKIFVYGKECLDLEGVDYDAISMLNVSATQELAKKVENLEQENSELRNESKRLSSIETQQGAEIAAMKSVESENADLKAEVEALKKAVATMQQKENGAVRTVALEQ
jgi:hypothetical protein